MKNRILTVWNFPVYIRAQSKEKTVLHNGAASSAMGYRDTTVIREGPPGETVLSAQQPATECRKAGIIHPRNPDLHPGGSGPFCYSLCGLTRVPRDSKEPAQSELLLPVLVPKLSPTVLSRTCQLDHIISRAHSRVWPQRRWCEAGSASQLWRLRIYQKQRLKGNFLRLTSPS